MSTFYVLASSREAAQSLAEEYGPDIWYDRRDNAEEVALPHEKAYRVTVTVEEDV